MFNGVSLTRQTLSSVTRRHIAGVNLADRAPLATGEPPGSHSPLRRTLTGRRQDGALGHAGQHLADQVGVQPLMSEGGSIVFTTVSCRARRAGHPRPEDP
ncbi:hypothetical protein GCM10018785_15980 [Streptomyces longispororuber]|uniref:Uncharacterized protein n=1 Tax=Streptomyces longispororuber TaxID=68230 RepID=A0A919DI82_9ACTN|nr:hypothetical protein GCM10018785_15980 [Streptomyces longispororuber]